VNYGSSSDIANVPSVLLASVMRLLAVHALMTYGNVACKSSQAFSYTSLMIMTGNTALVLLWSAVENHLAIFIACVPAVKSSLAKYFPSFNTIRGSVRRASASRATASLTKRSSATKSAGESTIVVKQDIEVDSFYIASRSGSKSEDAENVVEGYHPVTTVIEIDDRVYDLEKPGQAYLRSPEL